LRGLLLSLVLLCGCAHAVRPEPAESEEGDASYYGPGLYGHRTASGDVLRPGTLTAAHRTLPLGSCVRVTVLDSGRSVEVTVNDRGPYAGGRILDVSETAAQALGMVGRGVVKVRLTRCGTAASSRAKPPPLASWAPSGAWGVDDGCFSRWTPRH
jgi:rare lipoprotein A